ncbi:Putative methyltransferase NSUN6 [Galdieria sulphuraria]|nr:Putative methyltransferase NSUN6 [Galdieria sulphuraria]
MYPPYVYYIAYAGPFCTFMSLNYNSSFGKWCSIGYVFIMVPLMDFLLGEDMNNPTEQEEEYFATSFQYRLPLLLWLPVEFLLITKGAIVVSSSCSWTCWLTSTISVGLMSGVGITCAHELGHKTSITCSLFSKSLLLLACFGCFTIEHNYGHHKNVGTEEDPTTAKYNESFYRFVFRAIYGVVRDAWKIQVKALRRRGYSGVELVLRNEVFQDTCCSLGIGFTYCLLFGKKAMIFFFAQTVIAVSLLQLVNYIEHYGLVRRKLSNGTYEPVNICHSWDAPHKFTNFSQFKLQRHSDHHKDPLRPYQLLRTWEPTPKLPYGYPTMIVIALVPFVFFRLMNRLVPRYESSLT